MEKIKVYLAGPLFSVAERSFNARLIDALGRRIPNLNFILPQEQARKLSGQPDFVEKVFRYCIESIHDADVLLCILDGPDADSGTCIEIGYAYACKKPIIGLRTDFRSSEDSGVNLMVSRVCNEMIWLRGIDTNEKQAVEELVGAFDRVLARAASS